MNLTRSTQQRMIGQSEIHVNRLSSLGDDPKGCHTLAAVHLIFNSNSVSFFGPFTSVVEKHMNWSSWAGCPTHCQEETVTHILVISETTAEDQASSYNSHISGADWPDLSFQGISTWSACFSSTSAALLWKICRWRRILVGVSASWLAQQPINLCLRENFPLFLLPSADRLSVSSHCRHLAARLVGREGKKQTKPAAANLFFR